MRLLFDQNISFRILRTISQLFPEAKQVRNLGLEDYTDRQIWKYAKENHYTIVTFDADFYDLSNLYGHPPKIIWLRTGNRRTDDLAALLISRFDLIQDFTKNPSYKEIACIEIDDL